MPKFKLVEGDIGALTRAYNVLRSGGGTYLPLSITIEEFVANWQESRRCFAADSGLVAIFVNPEGLQAELVAAPFTEAFGGDGAKLIREIVPAYELNVLRCFTTTGTASAVVSTLGLRYDGLLRRFLPAEEGFQDCSVYSMLPEDLKVPRETDAERHEVKNNGGSLHTGESKWNEGDAAGGHRPKRRGRPPLRDSVASRKARARTAELP